jgi:hypothetical protein
VPVLGAVHQPIEDLLWWAARGRGAFQSQAGGPPQRMHVSTVSELGQARMVSSASIREPMVADLRKRAGIRDELQIGSVGIKPAAALRRGAGASGRTCGFERRPARRGAGTGIVADRWARTAYALAAKSDVRRWRCLRQADHAKLASAERTR